MSKHTAYRRIRRPLTEEEVPLYVRQLGHALTELGVERGEVFLVSKAPQDVRKNELGPMGKKETSRAAALQTYPNTGNDKHRILDFVRWQGGTGATRDQIEMVLGLSGSTVRPRVIELIEGGWLEETERTRKTRLGGQAFVLICTDAAQAVASTASVPGAAADLAAPAEGR
jgi:hypothetical protein